MDTPHRDLVFISHASETLDSEFSLWLSARLRAMGYDVWCDLHGLLGGENWDAEIEEAIKRSAKFIYVLTDHSNVAGPQRYPVNELTYAFNIARFDEVTDFVIPLQIASLKERATISLQGISANRDFFDEGWASGLRRLVRKLERDEVPRPLADGAAAMAAEWHLRYGSGATVIEKPERVRSNWFPLDAFPKSIYVHSFEGDVPHPASLPYPAVPYGQGLVSFATLNELKIRGARPNQLPLDGHTFAQGNRTDTLLFDRFVAGTWQGSPGARQSRDLVVRLVRGAWNQHLSARGLRERTLSGPGGERLAHWFPAGVIDKDKAHFRDLSGKRRSRKMAGKDSDSTWHLGLGMFVRTWPVLALEVRPHVFFSDNGLELWDDPKRSHKRSRRLRKSWRNDKWRDLIHAAVGWIAEEAPAVALPLSPERSVSMRSRSVTFESPVGYETPQRDRSLYVLGERAPSAAHPLLSDIQTRTDD